MDSGTYLKSVYLPDANYKKPLISILMTILDMKIEEERESAEAKGSPVKMQRPMFLASTSKKISKMISMKLKKNDYVQILFFHSQCMNFL